MKVALYYPWIYLTSGAERIIVELATRSRHQWTWLTSHYAPENTFPHIRGLDVVELNRVPVKRDILSSAYAASRIARQKLPLEGHDALFVLCEGLGDLILFRNSSTPSLCYCLTPLRAAFDPFYRAQSFEKRGPLGKIALAAGMSIFRYFDRRAWKRYTSALFISQEALRRARIGGLVDNSPREVLYSGIGLTAERPAHEWEPFFLIPGRIMWTKNVELGIAAFRKLASEPRYRHTKLIISGMVDEKSKPYFAQLQKLAAGDTGIEFRPNPSDAELRRLYETCYTVMFTPLNEDFGIVPLEAMAFGKPVIAINRGGPKETIDNGVQGFLVEPDAQAMAEKMETLLTNPDLAKRMGAAGFAKAPQFSWAHFVARIDDALEETAGIQNTLQPVSSAVSPGDRK